MNADYYRIAPQIHRGITLPNRDQITQVMESRSAVLSSHCETHWKYGKIKHEKGSKFRPSSKRNI